jgi:hypothetical protein
MPSSIILWLIHINHCRTKALFAAKRGTNAGEMHEKRDFPEPGVDQAAF